MAAPARPGPRRTLTDAQVRAVRITAQQLAGPTFAPPATVLAQCGPLRTLGGAEAYLALLARQSGLQPELLDRAVSAGEVRVVPALRGCIYLAAAGDAKLLLRVAEQLTRQRTARELERAGVEASELGEVAAAVLQALTEHGALTTEALRGALPQDAVRSLGERGRKVGITSPLPPALRQLELLGLVERAPHDGRLDHERYAWRRAATPADDDLPGDPVMLAARLLERWLRWAGVGSLRQFRAWSGLPAATARAALARAAHVAVTRDDGAEALARPDLDDLLAAAPAAAAAAALLPFEDNLVHLGGSPRDVADPALLPLVVPSWGRRAPVALGDAPHLALRAVVADGALCGFWEHDPDADVAVPFCFTAPSRAAQLLLEERCARVAGLLRGLGHGRCSSIDTAAAQRRRLAALRELHRDTRRSRR